MTLELRSVQRAGSTQTGRWELENAHIQRPACASVSVQTATPTEQRRLLIVPSAASPLSGSFKGFALFQRQARSWRSSSLTPFPGLGGGRDLAFRMNGDGVARGERLFEGLVQFIFHVSVGLRRAFRLRGDRCGIDALRSHDRPPASPAGLAVDCVGRQRPSGSRSRVGRAGHATTFQNVTLRPDCLPQA